MPKITKSGGILQFDGAPLKEFGVNSYQLFYQSIRTGVFTTPATRLAALNGYGVRIVRTLLCPFFPIEMDVYRDTPTTYFERMETFLDLCEANGISIIAVLTWRHATLTDPLDVNDLDTPGSTSRLLIEGYVDDVVSRFHGHNAIAAWEIGNEWDLYKDNASYLPSVSLVDETKSSYSAPNDVLTSTAITGVYTDCIAAIRAYDTERIIMAGTACGYGNVSTTAWQSSMATDCSGMDAYSKHLYPGVSGVYNTIYTGIFSNNCLDAFYGLRQLAKKAETDGNPLIVGEFGCSLTWSYANRSDIINRQVDAIIGANVPLALLWNYPDGPTTDYDITDLMPHMAEWTARMVAAASRLSPQGRVMSSDAGYFVVSADANT